VTEQKQGAPVIPEGPEGQAVRDAFAAFKLSPDNPHHWWMLLSRFVHASHKRAKAGAPLRWTDDSLLTAAIGFGRIQHRHPTWTESEICRQLAKTPDYKDWDWKTLRRKQLLNYLNHGVVDVFQNESGELRLVPRGPARK
jgi:hypothetical protein